MSLREERKELLDAARELILELRRITEPVNRMVNALIEQADDSMLDVADEISAAATTLTRKIRYGKLTQQLTDDAGNPPVSRRKCSICREPGHRATTCPNGRKEKG